MKLGSFKLVSCSRRSLQTLVCVLIATVSLLAFSSSLRHDFVNYDDTAYVTENPRVLNGLAWDSVTWAFTTGYFANWHPLTWLSHCLDVQLFGLHAGGHHGTSVVLHTANAVLLFLLLEGMTGALWRSAVVAALFALHPLHVESVAWISERKDVLSTFFALMSLWFYVRYARRWAEEEQSSTEAEKSRAEHGASHASASQVRSGPPPTVHRRSNLVDYSLALVCFALALMSKAMVVTLPFVMLLLDYWPLRRLQPFNSKLDPVTAGSTPAPAPIPTGRLLLEKVPFVALAVIAALISFRLLRDAGAINESPEPGVGARLAQIVMGYQTYLAKTVWPIHLATPYPRPTGWPASQTLWAVTLVTGFSLVALWLGRRARSLAVGWFWFLGALAPVIGVVQLGAHGVADRYTYFPLIGLFIAAAWGAADLAARWRIQPGVLGVVGVVLVLACLGGAVSQLRYWRNSEQLYRHALAVTEGNFMAHNGLGLEFFKQGRLEEAIGEYRVALQINPLYDPAIANLGRALAEKHEYAESAAQFEAAARLRPGDAAIHNNLGNVLNLQGRPEEAAIQFAEAVRLDPNHAGAHNNLAIACQKLGRTVEAIAHYREAIRLRPDSLEALNNLAWVLAADPQATNRNGPEAVELATRACELTRYQHPTPLTTLGAAYAETGQFHEAISFAERAKELVGGEGPAAERLEEMLGAFRATKPFRAD